MTKIRKFKIKGVPKDFVDMPFGRQIEYMRIIENFKANSKSTHLSQKRQSYQTAIKDAVNLLDANEYYCDFYCDKDCKDDSFQFWYN